MNNNQTLLQKENDAQSVFTAEELLERWKNRNQVKKHSHCLGRIGEHLGDFQLKIYRENGVKIYPNCALYYAGERNDQCVLQVLVQLEGEYRPQNHIFVKDPEAECWQLEE